MAFRLLLGCTFFRAESEQNSSHPTVRIPRHVAVFIGEAMPLIATESLKRVGMRSRSPGTIRWLSYREIQRSPARPTTVLKAAESVRAPHEQPVVRPQAEAGSGLRHCRRVALTSSG